MEDYLFLHRRRSKLTQHELGKRCGISAQYVCMIETGREVVSDDMAKRLSAALGLPVFKVFPSRFKNLNDSFGNPIPRTETLVKPLTPLEEAVRQWQLDESNLTNDQCEQISVSMGLPVSRLFPDRNRNNVPVNKTNG